MFVLQGLGGLGKTTLAFHLLPMLGADEEDVCTLWCHETENESNPAEQLVGQLLAFCRERFGVEWEIVVQQVDREAQDDSAQRFQSFLEALLPKVERLVLYLDNLESLLVGPRDAKSSDATDTFASWHSDSLRQIWLTLLTAAHESGKLHLVASCRYRNDDFKAATIPVSPLPPDALYRLMMWCAGLRRLAGQTRARLVDALAGHPRAVEFADDLIVDSLRRWEDRHGAWQLPEPPGAEDAEREWKQLVQPALPRVRDKLRDDLLLEAIWDRVLDDRARRMLYRMTLLRRPWKWDVMKILGEPDEPPETAEATAEWLRRTSLLEQVELTIRIDRDRLETAMRYTLHPTTGQFITERFEADDAFRRTTHLRVGGYFEVHAPGGKDINTVLEAGHHLFEVGEYERSYELLGTASIWFQKHGRLREGFRLLEPFLADTVRPAMNRSSVARLLANVGNAYLRLGRAENSITYNEQALAMAREIDDRAQELTALNNLGAGHFQLGGAAKAIEYYEQALPISRDSGDREREGSILGNLGNAYRDLGDFKKAIDYLAQALANSREIGDQRGEHANLGNLGLLRVQTGALYEGMECYEQALIIARAVGARQNEGVLHGSLGNAYNVLGQFDKAIQNFEQQLEIALAIGSRRGEAVALANLGVVHERLGQIDKAIGFFERSLAIGHEVKHPKLVTDVLRKLDYLQRAQASKLSRALLRIRVSFMLTLGRLIRRFRT
ncbi:MAG TPA: tetratricopeptide repeat protein [Vicinamibacterales bacterium]|nr:tetratricopeptide repeat protein [Vicinamibacterales bacterium]